MIGDDDVGALYRLPGLEVGAIAKEGAAAARATAMIGGHGGPAVVVDGFPVALPIPIPPAPFQGRLHGLIEGPGSQARGWAEEVAGERRAVFREDAIKPCQTSIAAPALGQGVGKLQPRGPLQIGQVPFHQLILQGDGGRGDHQGQAPGLGQGNGREPVGEGFPRPRAGLGDHHVGRTGLPDPKLVYREGPEGPGDLRNHESLPPPRRKASGRQPSAIGPLDLLAERGA